MQRYFVSNENFEKGIIEGEDVFHIEKVMRMKLKDQIIVCNYDGSAFVCEITKIKDIVEFNKLYGVGTNELDVEIYIGQGLVKSDKMDYVIQKVTELGCMGLIPLETKRSVVKLDDKGRKQKTERWQKIAKEASEQSHRNRIPTIFEPRTIQQLDLTPYTHLIVCYEEAARNGEFKKFSDEIKDIKGKMLVLVGPEGGFEDKEIEYLMSKGFTSVGLGKRILRSETAPVFVMSAVVYEKELR